MSENIFLGITVMWVHFFADCDELNYAIENDDLEMVKLLEEYDYSLTYEYNKSRVPLAIVSTFLSKGVGLFLPTY